MRVGLAISQFVGRLHGGALPYRVAPAYPLPTRPEGSRPAYPLRSPAPAPSALGAAYTARCANDGSGAVGADANPTRGTRLISGRLPQTRTDWLYAATRCAGSRPVRRPP